MQDLIQEAVDYALTNSLLKFNAKFELVHAPLTLTPYPISREILEQMITLTPLFNQLMLKVSQNADFLTTHLEQAARTDHFVKELLAIYQESNATQPYQLLISRNDYMLAISPNSPPLLNPKQVEFNTIAASYPFLATQLNHLHQFLYNRQFLGKESLAVGGKVFENNPLSGIVDAIAEAVKQYDHQNACVLSIVQPNEQNVFDQRGGEYQLWNRYEIPTIRLSLEEIAEQGTLKEGHLMVQGQIAAVTYFRAGYTPDDYQSPAAWKGRRLIETSSTIDVPNTAMQLAGLKKIQQVLADSKILRTFVEEDRACQIEATFVGLHLLDDTIEDHLGKETARERACRFPDNYVLKPQREGGGNNFYEEEMVQQLRSLSEEESHAYILMERINPPPHHAQLMREGDVVETSCISEIGRFGVCLAQREEILFNRDVGYLVRTKAADQNEGGVSAGYAYLNSLCHDR